MLNLKQTLQFQVLPLCVVKPIEASFALLLQDCLQEQFSSCFVTLWAPNYPLSRLPEVQKRHHTSRRHASLLWDPVRYIGCTG